MVLAILFGKRIRKKWEPRFAMPAAANSASSRSNCSGSGSQPGSVTDYTLKSKFRMRHAALRPHASVQGYIEDTLVFERTVETEGRMFARGVPVNPVGEVTAGQTCRVGGTELAAAEFHPD